MTFDIFFFIVAKKKTESMMENFHPTGVATDISKQVTGKIISIDVGTMTAASYLNSYFFGK